MQRSESRAESSLSGYAERRMLSTKSNAKELGENPMQRTAGGYFLLALQGRRLTNASRHGIYIINGRKVVVK